ncbi:c-type cytochrome domain-containing protein [Arenibacter echinorum]|uniref:Putative membrane protein n=1 Tax=Arenibacter echinorum TaxID=440515 RepID=A0A327QWA6_9FLAO|nr:c-type cytochrome domain-containing protein [Arenibacter echinorum]RAJ07964.1 putative membrane protein [Arenibacter echinorum]
MEVIQQLIGRLHPLVVHLPIGFIIAALLLQWYDRKNKEWSKILGILFQWAFIFATIACISGYLLYKGEGYSFDTVKFHLWLGIVTALFSLLMYLRLSASSKIDFIKRVPVVLFSFSLLFLISFTGHLGGNITHGSDYLIEPLPNSIKSILGVGPEVYEMPTLDEDNWEDAVLYTDLVQPILNNRCVSCHNAKKEKGELQLEEENGILRGGEDGVVIEPNDPEKSALYARLILPLEHEDHMPPKDKTQPSIEEIEIIKTWIAHKNSFDKTIGELGLKKELFYAFFPKEKDDTYPNVAVAEIPVDTIAALKNKGFHVERLSEESNFIKISCINKPTFSDKDFDSLSSVRNQVVYLDLGETQITDAIFEKISTLPNLTILKLDNTGVTGKNIETLEKLEYLKNLNLMGTNFEEVHLPKLKKFEKLQIVYLFNTPVKKPDHVDKPKEGELFVDYGGYNLPKIATDSIVF